MAWVRKQLYYVWTGDAVPDSPTPKCEIKYANITYDSGYSMRLAVQVHTDVGVESVNTHELSWHLHQGATIKMDHSVNVPQRVWLDKFSTAVLV